MCCGGKIRSICRGTIFCEQGSTNFKGALAEQFVLQELAANGIEPSYWTSDSGNAEVEFVIQGEKEVFPIEAKAGINTKAKSLRVYRELFNPFHSARC